VSPVFDVTVIVSAASAVLRIVNSNDAPAVLNGELISENMLAAVGSRSARDKPAGSLSISPPNTCSTVYVTAAAVDIASATDFL